MLPVKLKNIEIVRTDFAKVSDVIPAMLQIEECQRAMSEVDKSILQSTLNTKIGNADKDSLVSNIKQMSIYLAKDIGLNKGIDQYAATRFYDILMKYYSSLTLNEVKLAFELSLIGELDEYLPTNSSGVPDKNHYQSFSVEYVAKIIEAYKLRKSAAYGKAYDAVPEIEDKSTSENYKGSANEEMIMVILKYKYTGRYEGGTIINILLEKIMTKMGLLDTTEPTVREMKATMHNLMTSITTHQATKIDIKRDGIDSSAVQARSRAIATERSIKAMLDVMFKYEVDIKLFVNYNYA